MKSRTWKAALPAVAGAVLMAALTGFSREAGFRLVYPLLAACAWAGWMLWQKETDRRAKGYFGVVGVLFVLCCALGLRLEWMDETGWDGLALSLGLALCWGPAAAAAAAKLCYAMETLPAAKRANPQKVFWLSLLVILVCWLPVMIAYFPGINGYDMDFQLYMLETGDYSTHHPLLHTLFVGAFYDLGCWLGNPSLGYGAHTIVQALLLAMSMAYGCSYLARIRCPMGWRIGVVLFFSLSPQHAILAMSGTKDVLFAAAVLVVVVDMHRMIRNDDNFQHIWPRFLLMLIVAGMLRNNMLYGLSALLVVLAVFFRRVTGKRLLALLLAGVVLAQGGMSLLAAATDARSGSIREMLSVPCQQLARVFAKHGDTIPVSYEIRAALPEVERYAPERADFTKHMARVERPDQLLRFVKLWGREALNHPIEYIDAFLLNTKAYWYVDDVSFTTTYNDIPGQPVGFLSLRNNDLLALDAPSALPALRALWRELFTLNGYMQFPVLFQLLHPALYTWLLLLLLAWAAWRREKAILLPAAMLLSYLLTLFLGPCALIRYQYYLMLCAPLAAGLLCGRSAD